MNEADFDQAIGKRRERAHQLNWHDAIDAIHKAECDFKVEHPSGRLMDFENAHDAVFRVLDDGLDAYHAARIASTKLSERKAASKNSYQLFEEARVSLLRAQHFHDHETHPDDKPQFRSEIQNLRAKRDSARCALADVERDWDKLSEHMEGADSRARLCIEYVAEILDEMSITMKQQD